MPEKPEDLSDLNDTPDPPDERSSTVEAEASAEESPLSERSEAPSQEGSVDRAIGVETSGRGLGQWQYRPVPGDEPDPHEESASRVQRFPEKGFEIVGARVRGVKHKHDGTHCDDWFEFDTTGSWTVIAVSDGAGSARFSRVGARRACEAAVQKLCNELKDHSIKSRSTWSEKTFERDSASGEFLEDDLERVQKALHSAILTAYDDVEQAVLERRDRQDYQKILSREPTIHDFSATLLLAVHTTVGYHRTDYDLVMTCQVGDGMMAAIDHEGGVRLLAEPDKGSYGGETTFLTDKAKLVPPHLTAKTIPFFGPRMRTLMVMSDGVADIYFPPKPEMLRLYGDLVLSGVIGLKGPGPEAVVSALRQTSLPKLDSVKQAEYDEEMRVLTDKGSLLVRLPFVTAYAAKLGLSLEEVVANPALLKAGVRPVATDGPIDRAERLRLWLDSYVVRGERDDRTLVVLCREEVD